MIRHGAAALDYQNMQSRGFLLYSLQPGFPEGSRCNSPPAQRLKAFLCSEPPLGLDTTELTPVTRDAKPAPDGNVETLTTTRLAEQVKVENATHSMQPEATGSGGDQGLISSWTPATTTRQPVTGNPEPTPPHPGSPHLSPRTCHAESWGQNRAASLHRFLSLIAAKEMDQPAPCSLSSLSLFCSTLYLPSLRPPRRQTPPPLAGSPNYRGRGQLPILHAPMARDHPFPVIYHCAS